MARRAYNFSAGPAMLPTEVLEVAASQMLSYRGIGVGPMEISHRSAHFSEIIECARETLRDLLNVPQSHDILFMQGGGIAQNSIVPLNLMSLADRSRPEADFIVSGTWSEKTEQEAMKYGRTNRAVHLDGRAPLSQLNITASTFSKSASYLHVCSNETIEGVEILDLDPIAKYNSSPIVVDASSNILSAPVDFTHVAALYAGAQKNIGPAGVTVVIVRRDLLGHAHPYCPSAFDWRLVSEHGSMYNTPPTYGIYIAGLVFEWIRDQGGVSAMHANSEVKSSLIYDCIDKSSLYYNHIDKSYRSRLNVPFHFHDRSLEELFLEKARDIDLVYLKGHKKVGGIRASLYNAMPLEGVATLVDFMKEFERKA
ncbi:3-phosphoserine/phosphohydroxythreonine transaminase [Cupriavidus sp. YR651]|uniref:3-phosphoserine/phosphohydroxythreonine transaminase n=1 Tax=Cupriavidus sp. YR651 TaxID=1855315 RepID=UPI000B80CDBC|nr:3-phosphoserine/phosphohydroxythreonine transaminase [Cupriavidus sp. YR651]